MTLFSPLSVLFRCITGIRNHLFDRGVFRTYRASLPVISVGNVTVGGTGKTPLVVWLVEELRGAGRRPVVLSRGYKGSKRGPHLITDSDTALAVGDEPLLVRRKARVPVVVSKRRVAGAKLIERERLGDVIVLDDGFQHRWLQRDLDIVVCHPATERQLGDLLRDRLLPGGSLRESIRPAFQRAGVVVVSARSPQYLEVPFELQRLIPEQTPILRMATVLDTVRHARTHCELAPGEVRAACAIAHPESFFTTLGCGGYTVKEKHSFPDHDTDFEQELSRLLTRGNTTPIVITEKDEARLRHSLDVYVASVHVTIDDPRTLRSLLISALHRGENDPSKSIRQT